MTPDSAKYGKDWQIQRKRVQRQIVAGRGVCERCGRPICSDDHWSLSREAGGAIHSRCGFNRGLFGKAASNRWPIRLMRRTAPSAPSRRCDG